MSLFSHSSFIDRRHSGVLWQAVGLDHLPLLHQMSTFTLLIRTRLRRLKTCWSRTSCGLAHSSSQPCLPDMTHFLAQH